jgi:hypothetical protein
MASHWFEVRRGNNNKLYNAMRKYSDEIIVEVLHEGTVEDCLSMEYELRPSEMLGWNHGVGGIAPALGVSPSEEAIAKMLETKRANPYIATEETRKKLSDAGKGRKFSDETRKKISEKAKLRPARLSWNVPRANKQVWAKADEAYALYKQCYSQTQTAEALGLEWCKLISMFEKFNSGWNPSEDPQWKLFKDSQNNSEQVFT